MEEIKRLLNLYQEMVIDCEADHDDAKDMQPSSNFESQIRLYGCPILPPLMTDEKRKEMAAFRNLANQKLEAIEQHRKQKLIDRVQAIVDTIDDKKLSVQESQADSSIKDINLQVDPNHQQTSQTLEISSLNVEQRHVNGSILPVIGHESNTSIVTLSTSGSDNDSSAEINQTRVHKILNQLSHPKTVGCGSTKPEEAAVSSSSGTENSSLLQTVVRVDQEVDSITVLDKDSCSGNVSSILDAGNFENVQETFDLDKVRESVSDSEALRNYVGEYSLLPTIGPSSTPDLSFVSPEIITNVGLEADVICAEKTVDIEENIGGDDMIDTRDSNFSLDTIGQSCTLPVSLVTESTCSTLYEVVEPWNIPEEVVHDKDIKTASTSSECEETTPTTSHMRRNSYTLDHPSPALLEAQAQNRAPHIEDKPADDQVHAKPVRRALDLSDGFQSSGILQKSSPDNVKLDRKSSQVLPKTNSFEQTHKTYPDNQYDVFQSEIKSDAQNETIGYVPSKPAISTMTSEDEQMDSNTLGSPTMISHDVSNSEPPMNAIYLQQKMDLLERMQKEMMEEQQRQLESLMQQQKLQQRKIQEEMAELENQIRERKNITTSQAKLKTNYVNAKSSEGVQFHSRHDERTLPLSKPSSTISGQDSTGSRSSFIHGASDSEAVANEEHIAKWTTPTLQNLKVHNGSHFEKASAVAKGYLTRRLMMTDKVQSVVRTIKDMWQFIWQFQTETPVKRGVMSSSDTVLANRVLSQLRAAQFQLHDIFFGITSVERMAILAQQRTTDQNKSKNRRDEEGHFVSAATRKAMERRHQIRTAESKVFGRPQTAPPTHTTTQNSKSGKHGSRALSEEKSSRNLSKSVKVSHGGLSKTKSSSPSRKSRKTSHPFSRPLSAASKRSARVSVPKS
ncbi:centriolar coiled-coil protein of 110 kDa-like [Anneissia japonica]|uniref:centriolar coiled-coil protein of 110 kDa-like n=1 Tax=Anneissia japonica TaxID=1529436 RepID=UPI0014256459|nr:centriolar coiled-coil protein of 110 kDa-like [Anneissia japonica]